MDQSKLHTFLIFLLAAIIIVEGFSIYADAKKEIHFVNIPANNAAKTPAPPPKADPAPVPEPYVEEAVFRMGNEMFLEQLYLIDTSKRIGLVTNHSGLLPDGRYFLDVLQSRNANVVKLFSPEHGIRGNESYASYDSVSGLSIISLYDAKVKPSKADLDSIDILIYDIQDIGARFYTFSSTLYYILEAAADNQKQVIVCDRPMITNPNYVDGFMLDSGFKSFVGTIPTPVAYGMTVGELASYLNGEIFNKRVDLRVILMDNYTRSTNYNSLGLPWVKPSPSILSPSSAIAYAATCFLEGTNISEGRGTTTPFEYAGAPWVNKMAFADSLNKYNLPGVLFEAVTFRPVEVVSAYPPKFLGQECNGVYLHVTDKMSFEPVKAGIAILIELYKAYPEFQFLENNFIDKLAGTDKLRLQITQGKTLEEIIRSYELELMRFEETRFKYLTYY